MGLILVPVVEKVAEHITAMDEAYDNQMNFALSHVLGASIQTALLNTPLVVLVGWGLNKDMSLNFEVFDAIVLILAVVLFPFLIVFSTSVSSQADVTAAGGYVVWPRSFDLSAYVQILSGGVVTRAVARGDCAGRRHQPRI